MVGHARRLDEDAEVHKRMEEKDDCGVFRACTGHAFENNPRNREANNLRLTVLSMLETPELFQQFHRVRDEAWAGAVAYVEARKKEGAPRPVDPRSPVEGSRSLVVHLANVAIHKEDPLQRGRFYNVIDAVSRPMLPGPNASHRSVGASTRTSAQSRPDHLFERETTPG